MAIQRMSDQHKIKFLDKDVAKEDTKVAEKKANKTIEQIAEEQKSRKLNNKDDGLMTSRHISSARTGEITDMGGPKKYTKSETSNTNCEKDKNANSAMDNKANTIKEKEHIASNRREAEQGRMDDMVEKLKDTMQDKASSISSLNTHSGSNYKAPNNNMSMFDTEDFQRLPKKTTGETLTDEAEKRRAETDMSWRNGGKSINSREVSNRFFDTLFKSMGK